MSSASRRARPVALVLLATSAAPPDAAAPRTLESIGLPRDGACATLVQQGVLRDAGDGRVWLDEAALVTLGARLLARRTMSAGAA